MSEPEEMEVFYIYSETGECNHRFETKLGHGGKVFARCLICGQYFLQEESK